MLFINTAVLFVGDCLFGDSRSTETAFLFDLCLLGYWNLDEHALLLLTFVGLLEYHEVSRLFEAEEGESCSDDQFEQGQSFYIHLLFIILLAHTQAVTTSSCYHRLLSQRQQRLKLFLVDDFLPQGEPQKTHHFTVVAWNRRQDVYLVLSFDDDLEWSYDLDWLPVDLD